MKCIYCGRDVNQDKFRCNYIGKYEAYHGGCKLRFSFKNKKQEHKK